MENVNRYQRTTGTNDMTNERRETAVNDADQPRTLVFVETVVKGDRIDTDPTGRGFGQLIDVTHAPITRGDSVYIRGEDAYSGLPCTVAKMIGQEVAR